jgi:2-hydroxychromene-2-carboxylate isomerase
MALEVFLYVGYKSPFGYLAAEPTYQLEDDFNVVVRWRPYTNDIPSIYGAVDTRTEQQWRKVRYLYSDVRRAANKRGLIVRAPQKVFKGDVPCIGALYAQRAGKFRPYNDIVLERFWKRELDIDDREAIRAVLQEGGIDTGGFSEFLDGEGQAEYAAIRHEAHERGVFGVPTYVVQGELFWGYDRLDMLRERLTELGCRKTDSLAAE